MDDIIEEKDKSLENLDSNNAENEKLKGDEATGTPPDPDKDDKLDEDKLDENTPDPDKKIDETVPLAKYMAERKRAQEAARKLAEFEDAKLEEGIKNKKAAIKQKYLDRGYGEDVANDMAADFAELYGEIGKNVPKQVDTIIDQEIMELSADAFYSDIKNYSADIKDKITSAKKAGIELSVQDVYLSKINVAQKLKEMDIHNTTKNRIDNINSGNTNTNVPTAGGGAPKATYNLDGNDKKALAGLQKAQPEANWTPKKYHDMMIKLE